MIMNREVLVLALVTIMRFLVVVEVKIVVVRGERIVREDVLHFVVGIRLV